MIYNSNADFYNYKITLVVGAIEVKTCPRYRYLLIDIFKLKLVSYTCFIWIVLVMIKNHSI